MKTKNLIIILAILILLLTAIKSYAYVSPIDIYPNTQIFWPMNETSGIQIQDYGTMNLTLNSSQVKHTTIIYQGFNISVISGQQSDGAMTSSLNDNTPLFDTFDNNATEMSFGYIALWNRISGNGQFRIMSTDTVHTFITFLNANVFKHILQTQSTGYTELNSVDTINNNQAYCNIVTYSTSSGLAMLYSDGVNVANQSMTGNLELGSVGYNNLFEQISDLDVLATLRLSNMFIMDKALNDTEVRMLCNFSFSLIPTAQDILNFTPIFPYDNFATTNMMQPFSFHIDAIQGVWNATLFIDAQKNNSIIVNDTQDFVIYSTSNLSVGNHLWKINISNVNNASLYKDMSERNINILSTQAQANNNLILSLSGDTWIHIIFIICIYITLYIGLKSEGLFRGVIAISGALIIIYGIVWNIIIVQSHAIDYRLLDIANVFSYFIYFIGIGLILYSIIELFQISNKKDGS
jgi:hypothetical protein